MLLWHVRKNSGFTLLEMMVTLIIVSIIAAIAAPNFLGMLNRTRVKDGLGQVEGAIKEAQRLAIRRGTTCKIRFTTLGTGSDLRSVVQVRPDENIGGRIVSYSGCITNTRELPGSVSFGLLSGTTVTPITSSFTIDLGFSGKGNPVVPPGGNTMVISHPKTDTQKCIQIQGSLGYILTGVYDSTTQECDANKKI